MRRKWDIKKAQEVFAARGCKLLETEYVNDSTQMRYIARCGHERTSTFNNFLQGKGDLCRACRYADNGRKESRPDESMRAVFEAAGCKVITPLIANGRQKVQYIALCGHVNEVDFNHFNAGAGRLCRKCSKSVLYEIDYVRECFEQADCELLETEYVNCKTPMRYIAQCGHESVTTFDKFNRKGTSKRCRACHKHTYHDEPIDRNRTASKVWRKAVYEKDGYACLACGKHGGDLNAHHLAAYDTNPEQRFDVHNGVTLCPGCHTKFHTQYGFGGNTPEQFQEWLAGNTEVTAGIKEPAAP